MRIKKKIVRIILGILLIALLVVGALFTKEFFFPNDEKVIYGTRLKDIDKHKISDEEINKLKEGIKKDYKNITVRVSGKIIYIVMEVVPEMTLDTAKSIGKMALDYFSEDEKSYYDIQLMIDAENNSQYPIIGYKQRTRADIIWTRDRDKVEQ